MRGCVRGTGRGDKLKGRRVEGCVSCVTLLLDGKGGGE